MDERELPITSTVIGSTAARWGRAGSFISALNQNVEPRVNRGGLAREDHGCRVHLLDDGWPVDHMSGAEQVATVDRKLDEAAEFGKPHFAMRNAGGFQRPG